MVDVFFFFFFSSRRRHTRSLCDWSSDVCSSDLSEILPVVEKLDHALDKVRAEHPGFEIAVTGLSAIAARNSANMIEKLNRGLTIEFALVAIFIGLAFRSVVVMFSCILPG